MSNNRTSPSGQPRKTLLGHPVGPVPTPVKAAVKTVAAANKFAMKVLAIAGLISLAAPAGAQTLAFFNDPVATTLGGASGNPPALNIGNTFHVTGAGITVYQLGTFDWQGDGLAEAHTVVLFHDQTVVGSVTVPAGTAAPLVGGFRLAPLAAPVILPAGDYAVVTYQMNANDPYGENNAAGFNDGPSLSAGSGIYEFTTGTGYPTNAVTDGYVFASASFTYVDSTGVWTGGGADNNWSTAGNWTGLPSFPSVVTFAGTTRLANVNDFPGLTVNGLRFDPAAGAFVLSGNDVVLAGPIKYIANPLAPVTQTVNLNMTWGVDETIDTPANGNFAFGGAITGNGLTKTGNGTLTLGGANSITGLIINGGTNIITGNTTINGSGGRFCVANANPLYSGTLVIQPGAALTITGSFVDNGVIGRDGGKGTVIQNGGTFTYNPGDSHNFLYVGATGNPATRAEYHMNGGVLDMSGNTLGIGLGNGLVTTGLVYQVSGAINNVGTLQVGAVTANGHGIYTITGGSISIGSGGIITFSGDYEINLGGGTLGAYTSWTSALNMNLTGLNGPVTLDPAGNTILLSGVLSGSGGLTVGGSGTLELSGVNTYTGDTTVQAGGTLQLDTTGSTPGALRLVNGATLNLNYSGTYAVAHFYTNGVALPIGTYNAGNLGAFITGGGDLVVATGISTGVWDGGGADNNWSTGANWDQNAVPIFPIALTFAGTTRLTNNNDLAGLTASSLTFDAAAGPFALGGNDLTLAGGIGFNGAPVTPVTQTVNLGMTWTANKTIDVPTNASFNFGGAINGGSSTLTKTGNGSLALGGVDSFAGLIGNSGTTVISGTTTINGLGGGSTLYLGNQNAAYHGTLVIQPGAALNVAGSFGDAFAVGRDGGSGTIIQNGGTFTFNPSDHNYIFIGASSRVGTQSEYDLNGGVLDMSGNTLSIGLADGGVTATGVVNQVGGAINNVGNLWISPVQAGGLGIYTLSGGSISIGSGGITTAGGNYVINLGGGTVGAYASWSSALNMNLTNLNGSVTFNPAGNTILLSGVLAGNGGLTVAGSGTLELSGVNTYTGDTVVNAGCILQLDTAVNIPGAIRLVNGAALALNNSGTCVTTKFYTNGVALPLGVYTAVNLPGFITGSGSLQVEGLVFTVQPQNQTSYFFLNGNNHQSVTLTSAVTGGSASFQWYLNGVPVIGATSSNLTLPSLQMANAGNYTVVATGNSGSITSSVAALTVYGGNSSVFVYDGFNYAAGAVDGTTQAGGIGWNGPWQQVNGSGVIITAGNLSGGVKVPGGYDSRSIGNCVEVPSNAQTRSGRLFDCSATSELAKQGFIDGNGNVGANGKTVYLSFLQQADRTGGFYEMEFHRGNLSDPGRMGGIGNDAGGGNVNLRAPNNVNDRSLGAGNTAVNFYVVRIDYKAGNDDVFVYRNPTSLTEPATPTLTVSNVADMSFNGLSVAAYNGPDVKHDEIRLGATWADAIGVAVSNLLPPDKTANGRKIQFACTPGFSYRIQRTSDLTGAWTDITTVTGPANAYIEYEDTSAPAGQSFYRTVTP